MSDKQDEPDTKSEAHEPVSSDPQKSPDGRTPSQAFFRPAESTLPVVRNHRGSQESGSGSKEYSDDELPEAVDDYSILERLGTGGMGEVFLARDTDLSRRVALKRIRPDRAASPDAVRRFEIEARVTALLQHPSIIPVYHFIKKGTETFYTMRPVEGMTLGELRRRLRHNRHGERREWPTARLVRLFLQATNAVAYAHSRGVIHRDLKPDNIMIGPFEEVLVLDWGMAKILGQKEQCVTSELPTNSTLTQSTASPSFAGTPSYMAPERLRHAPANFVTEVFSLGIILYELLSFRPPWKVDRLAELPSAMASLPRAPSFVQPGREIPGRLDEVVLKAMQANPADRFATVREFSQEVASAMEGRAPWERRPESADFESWRIADGRMRVFDDELDLVSRGNRNRFRLFCENAFADNLRFEFEMKLRRGSNELSIWINAALDESHGIADGYCLTVVPGRRRIASLLRSGRDVAGAQAPEFAARTWIKVRAVREDNRLSLSIDGKEIYAYQDPIPMTGGKIGLTGQTGGMRIRKLRVSSRGTDATVSCLSIPDAFFNRGLFEEARSEYDRVSVSHPTRNEGRLACFRAGLCMLELHRRETEPELRALLLQEARDAFTGKGAISPSCLTYLGLAMVAREQYDTAGKHEALVHALNDFPDDPHRGAVHEWILGGLHSVQPEQRHTVAELLPIAITHCNESWGRRVVRELMHRVRRDWETPSFFESRGHFKDQDRTSQAESIMFCAFWSGRTELIAEAWSSLLSSRRARPHHLSDAFFALVELGAAESARSVLQTLPPSGIGPLKRHRNAHLCRATLLALDGDLEQAETMLIAQEAPVTDRCFNSSRLWIARQCYELGEPERLARVLRRRGQRDFFAREHRAWFALHDHDIDRSERELKPFIRREDHLRGRNLVNFLYGCLWELKERPERARSIFRALEPPPWPRTWLLGSHYAAGYFEADESGIGLQHLFPWELRVLESHRALLERVRQGPAE